jgi:hypothetical protein
MGGSSSGPANKKQKKEA